VERVAFLIERTGDRLGCLLNPETLTVRRRAGLLRRASNEGPLHGAGLADDPLIFTGGGSTEMTFDLLFDTSLASGSSIATTDVRQLTRPLWDLAENPVDSANGEPPYVWFVWGRAWRVRGLVGAVAERVESFTQAGVPRRSWLRLQFQRAAAPGPRHTSTPVDAATLDRMRPQFDRTRLAASRATGVPHDRAVEVTGGTPATAEPVASTPTRLDELADRYLGNAGLWRLFAWVNDVADPLHISAGRLLRVPPRPAPGASE
jgi:hypothetical protein